MGRRFSVGRLASKTCALILLGILFVFTIFPVAYSFLASFKTNAEVITSSRIIPSTFRLDNYRAAWKLAQFGAYTWNSLYMAFFIVAGTILTSTAAGYVFSRGRFPGKRLLFGIITATMFLSVGSLYLYPQLVMAKFLHLNRSLWGVIVINIFGINVTQLYLARTYIDSIPREIDEAAMIDGCGFFRIYRSIVLPLVKPLIATVGLLSFMNSWNDYLLPMVFTLGRPEIRPLVVGIVALKSSGEAASAWNLMLAGTTMSMLPILAVYLFLNRYFISGLTSGAVKG